MPKTKKTFSPEHIANLDRAIAILGFGLGAAQIGVSTAPYIIPQQPPKPIQLPLHPFVLSVVLSLVFGIAGAFVGWGLSHLLLSIAARRSSHQPKISNGSQKLQNKVDGVM